MTELSQAHADRDEIDRVETLVRNALLQMLSEARTLTLKMDGTLRDKLMDGLASNFHPDAGVIQDCITAAFYDVKNLADEVVEERRLEAKYPMRAAE